MVAICHPLKGKTMSFKVPGRAYTPEEKREVMRQLTELWIAGPQDMRLGQLLINSLPVDEGPELFYVEDLRLVKAVGELIQAHPRKE